MTVSSSCGKSVLLGAGLCFLCLTLLCMGNAQAQPVYCTSTGHYYELVSVQPRITWTEARANAQQMTYASPDGALWQGHLATVTSEAEEQFLLQLLGTAEFDGAAFLGGYQDPFDTSDPAANWYWITGESWGYVDWVSGEPNDYQGTAESVLDIMNWGGRVGWQDVAADNAHGAYVVEYVFVSVIAAVDVKPDTLDLESKGNYVTAYIELPASWDVNDIDVTTVHLAISEAGSVQALASPTEVGDYDADGVPDLMVKFDRQTVAALLTPADEVILTVSGQLQDGTLFSGEDTITVISPPDE